MLVGVRLLPPLAGLERHHKQHPTRILQYKPVHTAVKYSCRVFGRSQTWCLRDQTSTTDDLVCSILRPKSARRRPALPRSRAPAPSPSVYITLAAPCLNPNGRAVLDGGERPQHSHVGEGEANGDGGEGQPEVYAPRPFNLLYNMHMPAWGTCRNAGRQVPRYGLAKQRRLPTHSTSTTYSVVSQSATHATRPP